MSNQYKVKLSEEKKLLHIATLGKTVGVRGDMKLHIKCDFPNQFKDGATFLINAKESITLESVNLARGLARVLGVTSVEDAKRYTNVKLFTTYDETRKNCHLKEGEFFWFDIVGCDVVEDGKILGKVQEVQRITTSDYLNIKTSDALLKAGYATSFLLPYHEPFILHTDIENKSIEVSGGLDILEAS